ncbi:MAG: agmatinase [Paracoccaceae bacterium]
MRDGAETRLATYGTFPPGRENHHVVAPIGGVWSEGWLEGDLRSISAGRWAGYAGFLPMAGARLPAWLLEAPDLPAHWSHLDAFEGPALERRTLPFHRADGTTVPAQVYVLRDAAGLQTAAPPRSLAPDTEGQPMTDTSETPPPGRDDPQQRPRYTGPASFFRLPYREDFETEPPEIGLVGVPYDGGVTNRPGARHGPREVRNQSSLIRRENPATGARPFAKARVADIGDVWVERPFDLSSAHREIEAGFRRIHAAGIRPLTCGGDHSISLPILRAIARDGPLGMVHIDAHSDTGGDYLGSRFHHGAPFSRAVEEGLLDPRRIVQIGIRGSLFSLDMWAFNEAHGITVIPIEAVEETGWAAAMDRARTVVGSGPVYASFDIDSLDPAFAPGTGTPEAGGLTMREAQGMVRRLAGLDIRGADMVEVAPAYDVGGITALNGATILYELLCVMADPTPD